MPFIVCQNAHILHFKLVQKLARSQVLLIEFQSHFVDLIDLILVQVYEGHKVAVIFVQLLKRLLNLEKLVFQHNFYRNLFIQHRWIQSKAGEDIFANPAFSSLTFLVIVSENNFFNKRKVEVFVKNKENLFRRHIFIENGQMFANFKELTLKVLVVVEIAKQEVLFFGELKVIPHSLKDSLVQVERIQKTDQKVAVLGHFQQKIIDIYIKTRVQLTKLSIISDIQLQIVLKHLKQTENQRNLKNSYLLLFEVFLGENIVQTPQKQLIIEEIRE